MRSFARPRAASRSRLAVQSSKGGDNCACEFWIVDMPLDPDQLPTGGLAHRPLERREQRGIGSGVMKRLTGLIERRNAKFGQEEAHRTIHEVQPFADPPADLLIHDSGRAHNSK